MEPLDQADGFAVSAAIPAAAISVSSADTEAVAPASAEGDALIYAEHNQQGISRELSCQCDACKRYMG